MARTYDGILIVGLSLPLEEAELTHPVRKQIIEKDKSDQLKILRHFF
jgi:hypothetical protein